MKSARSRHLLWRRTAGATPVGWLLLSDFTDPLNGYKKLTLQGTAEFQAKVDSTNNTADTLTIFGGVNIAGNAKLTAVSINLINGKVKRNNTWTIISVGGAGGGVTGDFATKVLDFNDGSGNKYTGGVDGTGKKYQLTSPA